MNSHPHLSIIIVNYNTPQLTYECIESIYRFPPSCPFEVLVMDNGSDENLQERLNGDFANLRFIEMGANTGFAKANNLAVYNARGRYLVFLNSDTLLGEDCFSPMIEYLETHPKVGAIGPRQMDGRKNFQLSCGKFPTFFSELVRRLWHYRLSLNDQWIRDFLDQRHATLCEVDWISGSCMMTRRETLEATGLFDERFFMYFEDIDLCRRIWEAGYEVHFYHQVSLLHYGGKSAQLNLLRVLIEYRKSQIYFARKYYGRTGEWTIRLMLLGKYLVHFVQWFPVFVMAKMARRDTEAAYTHSLLAKKGMELVFQKIASHSLIPQLFPLKKKAPSVPSVQPMVF
ncbi:MAG: glycosyltransferase family 2 protein [Candidatus Omnitrophota bacterium]